MATFENDQTYIAKIKKMVVDDPMRLISELHEAHYLLENEVISESCYERVKQIVNESDLFTGKKD